MGAIEMYEAGKRRGMIAGQVQAASDAIRLDGNTSLSRDESSLSYQRGYLDGFRAGMKDGWQAPQVEGEGGIKRDSAHPHPQRK